MNVRLVTADDGLVQEVVVPPFQKMPEVIMWGERFFIPADLIHVGYWKYREVFCYAVPPEG